MHIVVDEIIGHAIDTGLRKHRVGERAEKVLYFPVGALQRWRSKGMNAIRPDAGTREVHMRASERGRLKCNCLAGANMFVGETEKRFDSK